MPAVCRFYLKGYCRYGANCRFEHPGEFDEPQPTSGGRGGGGGFSFTKALEEVSTSKPSQGFSFTRALQTVDNRSPFNQQHNQNESYYQQNQYRPHNTSQSSYQNNSYFNTFVGTGSGGYDASPFRQTYNSRSTSGSAGFSFTQALNNPVKPFQNNLNSGFAPSPFGQLGTSNQFQNNDNDIEIDVRGGEQIAPQDNETPLTDIEIKAYQSDEFTFRLIPIRPPPQHLIY